MPIKSFRGQIADRDEVVGQENVSKHADRLVALSTMGFSKTGNKSMSLHEMVDLAANKDTTIGTSDWSAETSIGKISERIGTMSLQDFKNNNVDYKATRAWRYACNRTNDCIRFKYRRRRK